MNEKSRFHRYVKFLIYAIAVVLINIAGMSLFSRIDLTKNDMFSISKASKRVVSTLSEPLTIKVFFSKNLPAPHNNTERYLHDLLEEYAIHANQYFNYRFYDVSLGNGGSMSEKDENQQIANNYGIRPIQLQNIEQDELKFQKAYMGMVIIHGDMIEKIPTITTTDGFEYKLTTTIQKLNNKISALLNLKNKIRIRLVLSSSLKTIASYIQLEELPELPRILKELVEKLNAGTYGKLAFEYLDPSKDKSLEGVVKEHNILSLSWPAIPDGGIEPGTGSVGLIMEYEGKAISIPIVNVMRIPIIGTQYKMVDMDNLERIVNENIESIVDINEDIGYFADHGTLQAPMDPMMNPMQQQQNPISNFQRLTSQNYTIRDLAVMDNPIPDGFNCLIIAGPTEPFTEYELFQIDQYLMRGRNLALFLDTFNEVSPPANQPYAYNQGPQFVPINTGLEKLLGHYGVRMGKSYVMDENCFKQRTRDPRGGGETPLYFAPIIKDRFINHAPDFMKNIKELVVMKASPLTLDEEKIKNTGLKAIQLLASSDKSWEMSGRINLNPMMIQPPSSDEMQSLPLAYILEGEFSSYYTDKQIPEKQSKKSPEDDPAEEDSETEKPKSAPTQIKGEGEIITKGKPGKIFLIGTSEVLKNNMLDREGLSTNATFIMNVLDELNDRSEIALMRSKEQLFNPLTETGPGIKTFVKAFNIAGLPVLVVLMGLLVWFRRHARQKNIQLMFQK